ncbi:MAG: hypothetical protein KTR30_10810 [Saprospiraceae bacterium]|nr:hypothetical protein [Saprospiraceae bacterium]
MRLNRNIIGKTKFDSRFINILACTVHPLKEPGAYFGTVYLKKEIAAEFEVFLDEGVEVSQVNIDMDALVSQSLSGGKRPVFKVGKNGHVLFCATKSDQAFRVRLTKNPEQKRPDFDSKNLQENDLYITQYFQPGKYVATHSSCKGQQLEIDVAYPQKKRHSRSSLYQKKNIEIRKDGFSDQQITLLPLQALVFNNLVPGHIVIELVEACPKPDTITRTKASDLIKAKLKKKGLDNSIRKYRWRNPKYRHLQEKQ